MEDACGYEEAEDWSLNSQVINIRKMKDLAN
jgi:hypothetical protein